MSVIFYDIKNCGTPNVVPQAVPYIGEAPFIHWMGPFSVGIYRYQSIFFKVDSGTPVKVEIIDEQDPQIFSLYDPSVADSSEYYEGETWSNVDNVCKKLIYIQPVQGMCQLVIVCKAELEGEYIINISIGGAVYRFGAAFYGENESLGINLVNRGVELPNFIGRALYEGDVYEERPDWILLNNKYRELLMNFLDVVGNKGSYKSLKNSLAWFDYDKLVQLKEVWKYETPDGTKFFEAPIQEMLSSETERWLFNSAKTTYFSLTHPKGQYLLADIPAHTHPDIARAIQQVVDLLNYELTAQDVDKMLAGTYISSSTSRDIVFDGSIEPKGTVVEHKHVGLHKAIEQVINLMQQTISSTDVDKMLAGTYIEHSDPQITIDDSIEGPVNPHIHAELKEAVAELVRCIKRELTTYDLNKLLRSKSKIRKLLAQHLNVSINPLAEGSPVLILNEAYEQIEPANWQVTDVPVGLVINDERKSFILPIVKINGGYTFLVCPESDRRSGTTWAAQKTILGYKGSIAGTEEKSILVAHQSSIEDVLTALDIEPEELYTIWTGRTAEQSSPIVFVIPKEPEHQDKDYVWVPTEYDWDCLPGKKIQGLACKWSEHEMRLKMVLLGNFFETYFMPIHTELIRSCVEEIPCMYDIFMQSGSNDCYHEECFTEAGNFDLDWTVPGPGGEDTDGEENGDGTGSTSKISLYLDEVHVVAGLPRTDPYGQALENNKPELTDSHYKGLPYVPIVACHTLDEADVELADYQTLNPEHTTQIFNGLGSVAKGTFTFVEPIISGSCETNIHGHVIRTKFSVDPSQAREQFTIKFLFQRPGDFIMVLRFMGTSGRQYSKKVEIHVEDNLQPDIDIKILKSAYNLTDQLPNPFTALPDEAIESPNKFMFARTKDIDYQVVKEQDAYRVDLVGDWGYSQYIPLRPYYDTELPQDAPYKTRVYTAQFRGTGCYNELVRFMNQVDDYGRNFRQDCWFRIGYENVDVPEQSAWCWIQYIYKERGVFGTFAHNDAEEYYERDVYIPEHMKLEDPGKDVPSYYPVVCVPCIKVYLEDANHQQYIKKVPYSFHVDERKMVHMWEFFSWNLQMDIAELKHDVVDPFMSWDINRPLPRGYYTITFRYDFGDGPKEIVKHTPFKLEQA